jgi:type 1 glutamine amidotransferase
MLQEKIMRRTLLALIGALACWPLASRAAAPRDFQSAIRNPRSAMILDGESAGPYHRWQVTTPVLKAMLAETRPFAVDVVTAPAATGQLGDFHPDFAGHDVVVLNYDAPDDRWPAGLKTAFERYVDQGGGLVVVHASDNAFPEWKAFNEMIGVGGWRNRTERAGPYWFVKDGALVSDNAPGPAGSHGARQPYRVTLRDSSHPITRGLPAIWMHQGDELYAALRGPGRNMTVLATAHSDPANNGTGRDEPQLVVVQYGRGRVFHTTMGHDVNGMSSVDFVTTFQRGVEWAATGAVTQSVPASFPTASTVSYRADLAAMDPLFRNGLNPLDQTRR